MASAYFTMRNTINIICLLFVGLVSTGLSADKSPSNSFDLKPKTIFSKGANKWEGNILAITKGRGSRIGWYVTAKKDETISVSIEFSNAQTLDQSYQLSFDGKDTFWSMPVTGEKKYSIKKIGDFTVRKDSPMLIMLVPPSNRAYKHPVRFKRLILQGKTAGNLTLVTEAPTPPAPAASPGFGEKLTSIHPALSSRDLREDDVTWRITGMAIPKEGELLFTTWEGDLFQLDLNAIPKNGPLPYRRIAQGLSEPMGLAVTEGRIFVTEKNQVTELTDSDGDKIIDTYRCISHDWPSSMDYHEYLFGAVIQGEHIYFSSSVAMKIRNLDNRQMPLRGSVLKVHLETGETEIVAGGLRTPNGIGFGPNEEILIADNQGEWLPGSKLIVVKPGAFFNFRSQEPWHPFDHLEKATLPAVWLPHGEIAASPTEPFTLPENWGPYAGQVLYGDATFGGLERVFLEEVNGVTQGAAFHFSQGFQHLFNRVALTKKGELYAGGIARGNDWDFIRRVSGLTHIKYTGKDVFDLLAVRAKSNGLEIEFTHPLAEGQGWDPAGYYLTQWTYQAVQTYGGPKVRHRRSPVFAATVSKDRKRVFLELPDMVEGEIIHVRLPKSLKSSEGSTLWAGEAWYTLNQIPNDRAGKTLPRPKEIAETKSEYFTFNSGEERRRLYQTFCAACHSLDGRLLPGPTFHQSFGTKRKVVDPSTGKTKEVMRDDAYILQSIMEPNALLAEGYPANIMPPLSAVLSEKQIKAIIAYIKKESK